MYGHLNTFKATPRNVATKATMRFVDADPFIDYNVDYSPWPSLISSL